MSNLLFSDKLYMIALLFDIKDEPYEVIPFGDGLINTTYKVVLKNTSLEYIC